MKWWKDLLFICSLNNVPAQCVLGSLPYSAAQLSSQNPLAESFMRIIFFFLFPSTLPSKSYILGTSTTLFFSLGLLSLGPWAWEPTTGTPFCYVHKCTEDEPTGYSRKTSLLSIVKSLAILLSFSIPSGTSEFFSLISGRALRLPWDGLFSVLGEF